MTPQEVRDMKMRRKADKAYDQSLTSTEAAPMPKPAMPMPAPRRSPMEEEMLQDVRDEKARDKIKSMGYAKGGKVGGASRRADGCAQRGKTKGRMI